MEIVGNSKPLEWNLSERKWQLGAEPRARLRKAARGMVPGMCYVYQFCIPDNFPQLSCIGVLNHVDSYLVWQ
jgi:hypothetical protein